MQLYMIILMMALMGYREVGYPYDALKYGEWTLAVVLGPLLAIALATWTVTRSTLAAVKRAPAKAERRLARLRLFNGVCHWSMVGLFLFDLYYVGWLHWLQVRFGDLILVNDVIALLPIIGTMMLMWAVHYPLDRHLRGAHRDDDGRWPRVRFVVSQVRHQLLVLLVPLLLMLGWFQTVERYIENEAWVSAASFAGFVVVFAAAPMLIRFVWDTVPLPPSDLRDRLMHLCDKYRVGVRRLLLWRTHGGLINGAVMGVAAPLRYILLTDGLIERMSDEHIEAVMAHELGHIRRHHMPWLLICAGASLGFVLVTVSAMTSTLIATGVLPEDVSEWTLGLVEGPMLAVLMLGWMLMFGYISRRFERQADTFAVQHMAERYPSVEQPGVITQDAVDSVAGALRQVALLNHLPVDTPRSIWHAVSPMNWRHGTIGWRIQYLKTLVGRRVDACPIDNDVRRIRWTCAAVLLMVVLFGAELW